jgi:dUTP pyrophosphatase
MDIKIKKLTNTAKLPQRQTVGSAGADLHADITEAIVILPHRTVKIPTGLAIELPDENYVALIYPRSGLSTKHGIALANKVAVIDSDYRGEMQIPLHNHSDEAFVVQPDERVAQLVIMPVLPVNYVESNELTDTERGIGGFGSTGVK